MDRARGLRRPKLLVLGTGAKRSAIAERQPIAEAPYALETHGGGSGPGLNFKSQTIRTSLYEITCTSVRHQIITKGESLYLKEVLGKLPKALLLDVLNGVKAKLTALQTISITKNMEMDLSNWANPIWERLCNQIQRQLGDGYPERKEREEWRLYYLRLASVQDERILTIGSRLRETYKEGEAQTRTLKVIGPRRNTTVLGSRLTRPEPLANASARSSLMKRSRTETISISSKGRTSAFPPATSKMIPPRKR